MRTAFASVAAGILALTAGLSVAPAAQAGSADLSESTRTVSIQVGIGLHLPPLVLHPECVFCTGPV